MKEIHNNKRKYAFNEDSDSDGPDEVTIRGRCTRVRTCCEISDTKGGTNDFIVNYDSDINDSFMFDSDDEIFVFSDSNNIDLDKLPKICKINNVCNNFNLNVNENCNNKNDSNKDENNENYINKKCSFVTNPKINKIRTMV